jgi:hypothetical protein
MLRICGVQNVEGDSFFSVTFKNNIQERIISPKGRNTQNMNRFSGIPPLVVNSVRQQIYCF